MAWGPPWRKCAVDGDRLPLADRCHGRWKSILPALGIHPSYLTGRNGPCPVCRAGRDRWRFIERNGSGDWLCRQCDPHRGSGTQLVIAFPRVDFKREAKEIEEV